MQSLTYDSLYSIATYTDDQYPESVLRVLSCVNKSLHTTIDIHEISLRRSIKRVNKCGIITYYLRNNAPYGVNWYLPKSSSMYTKYNSMFAKAVELNCTIDTIKTIISRISKSHNWILTRELMYPIIKHERVDILNYIKERRGKLPAIVYLRDCLDLQSPLVAEFIASQPHAIEYVMYSTETTNNLTVSAINYIMTRDELTQAILNYTDLPVEKRERFHKCIEVLITNNHIKPKLIAFAIRTIYRCGDYSTLLGLFVAALDKKIQMHKIKQRGECNNVLSGYSNIKLIEIPWN
ncbi:hypothetical protein F-VV10_0137 [Faustovirus]|nr:hypothetical protein F-VV10_0137 [Faustovirus]